jgi:hypothetical protein
VKSSRQTNLAPHINEGHPNSGLKNSSLKGKLSIPKQRQQPCTPDLFTMLRRHPSRQPWRATQRHSTRWSLRAPRPLCGLRAHRAGSEVVEVGLQSPVLVLQLAQLLVRLLVLARHDMKLRVRDGCNALSGRGLQAATTLSHVRSTDMNPLDGSNVHLDSVQRLSRTWNSYDAEHAPNSSCRPLTSQGMVGKRALSKIP